MLSVNRASVLIAAALAVASPLASGALAWAFLGERTHGLGYYLLYWPVLLIGQLPQRASDVLMASGLAPLLLYFGAYLLACHGVRLLWRRLRGAGRASS
jgi:hypothetical protein